MGASLSLSRSSKQRWSHLNSKNMLKPLSIYSNYKSFLLIQWFIKESPRDLAQIEWNSEIFRISHTNARVVLWQRSHKSRAIKKMWSRSWASAQLLTCQLTAQRVRESEWACDNRYRRHKVEWHVERVSPCRCHLFFLQIATLLFVVLCARLFITFFYHRVFHFIFFFFSHILNASKVKQKCQPYIYALLSLCSKCREYQS